MHFDNSLIVGKCRHSSRCKCFNLYPTALFRQRRFGYPTFGTLSFAPTDNAYSFPKAKEPNLASPQNISL